jgi:hypothetical protein
MNFKGWVKYDRAILQDLYVGALTPMELAAITILRLLADASTGGYSINAPALNTFSGGQLSDDIAQRVLISLSRKKYIRRWPTKTRDVDPYLIHGYEITVGEHKGKFVNALLTTDPRHPVYEVIGPCVAAVSGADVTTDVDADVSADVGADVQPVYCDSVTSDFGESSHVQPGMSSGMSRDEKGGEGADKTITETGDLETGDSNQVSKSVSKSASVASLPPCPARLGVELGSFESGAKSKSTPSLTPRANALSVAGIDNPESTSLSEMDMNAEALFQTFFPTLRPEIRDKKYPTCLEIADLCKKYGAFNILAYNRTHKTTGKSKEYYFHTPEKMLRSVKSTESGNILDQYAGHDPDTCKICKGSTPSLERNAGNISIRELAREYGLINFSGKWYCGTSSSKKDIFVTFSSKEEMIDELVIRQNSAILAKLKELVAEAIDREANRHSFTADSPEATGEGFTPGCLCGYDDCITDEEVMNHQRGCMEYLREMGA